MPAVRGSQRTISGNRISNVSVMMSSSRNGMTPVKIHETTHFDLDPAQEILVNVFQYMIGNTEYSLVNPEPNKKCCHNSDVLSDSDGPPYTPLIFDFDFSGFVNAPYAQPNPRYPIPSVRHRFYKGLCDANDILPGTLQVFLNKKDNFYQIIDELEPLSRRSRNHVRSYLKSFYDTISDPALVKELLVDKCFVPAQTQP